MSFQLSSNAGAATQYLAEADPFDSFYDELESGGVEVFVESESESPAVAPLKPLSPPPAETEVEVRLRSCLQEAFSYFRGNLEQAGEQAKVSAYLTSREIPPEVADRFQIGWAPEGWTALRDHLRAKGFTLDEQKAAGLIKEGGRSGHYDRLRDRLILPLRDQWGRLTGFAGRSLGDDEPKYLNPPATELYHKSDQLFALDLARETIHQSGSALVVEGYLDVTRLQQHGFEQAVAACGTAFGMGQLKELQSVGAQRVDLLFDGDNAGIAAAKKTALLLVEAGVPGSTIVLPEGLDPDDLLKTQGRGALEQIITDSKSHASFLIDHIWGKAEEHGGLTRMSQALEELIELGNKIKGDERSSFFAELVQSSGQESVLERMKPIKPAQKPQAARFETQLSPGALAAARATHYFKQGDPIDQLFGPALRHATKEWVGTGAQILGISGAADMKDFELLHQGFAPSRASDQAVGREPKESDGALRRLLPDKAYKSKSVQMPDGTTQQVSMRRGCEDIPFAPPKSVSVLALHCGDHRLVDLHVQAVKKVVDYYERNLTVYRKTEAGVTTERRSDNLTVLLRHHGTSRDDDPQLHTHVQFMNLTQTPNGWRSRVNDSTFRFVGFLNALYQSEMAKGVSDLGYEVAHRAKGKWEVAGLSESILDQFSQRSADIKEVLPELRQEFPHASGRELRQIATLYTRRDKAKETPNLEKLRLHWQNKFPREAILNRALAPEQPGQSGIPESAEELLSMAARHLSTNESAFAPEDLMSQALALSRGRFVLDDLERGLGELINRGELVERQQPGAHDQPVWERLATREIYEMERRVEASIIKGRNSLPPLVRYKEVEAALEGSRLSPGQQEAVRMMLLSTNRYGLIQGDAGTGKTTAVSKVREILEIKQTFVPIRGLGFTGRATAELTEASGVPGSTIDAFLRIPVDRLPRRALLVVDESSMVSSRHLAALVERAEATDSRLTFVGDGKQLAAIGAGRLFLDLQERSATGRVHMSQVFRQQTAHLQQVVDQIKSFAEGRNRLGINRAFETLKANQGIVEDPSDKLLSRLADAYVERYGKVDVLAVVNTNLDRQNLNDLIRTRLVNSEKVAGEGVETDVLFPIPFRDVERFEAESFKIGDRVVLSKSLGPIEEGQETWVTALHPERRSVELNGVEISLAQHQEAITIYRDLKITIAQGDKLVFLKNDHNLGVQNGLTAMVEQVSESGLSVQVGERRIEVPLGSYPYLDHGYSSTVQKSQGTTCDSVLALAKTDHKEMNHAGMFYTAITRARHEALVFTDDVKVHGKQLSMVRRKTTTLDFPDQSFASEIPDPLFQPTEVAEVHHQPSPESSLLLQAAKQMSRHQSMIDSKSLFSRARSMTSRPLGATELPRALAELKREGQLLEFQGARLVLSGIYRTERQVRDRVEAGKSKFEPLKEGAPGLLGSRDQYVFLETKTQEHLDLLKQAGLELVPKDAPYRPRELAWLSRSKAKGQHLESQTGLRAYSWRALLSGTANPQKGTWLAVEDSQGMNWRDWDRLTAKAEELELRIAFIGSPTDDRGPGGLFAALSETFPEQVVGLESSMDLSHPKNERICRSLSGFLDQSDKGGVRRSFKTLAEAGRLSEAPNAETFAQQNHEDLLVAFDRQEASRINQSVREERKAQGELADERHLFMERPVRLSSTESLQTSAYKIGDSVQVLETFGQFEEGMRLQVTGTLDQRLLLDGVVVSLEDHADKLQVLRTEPVPLAVGESLVLQRAHSGLELKGGERATLEGFGVEQQEGLLALRLDGGQLIHLDPKQYPHLDYGYCITPIQLRSGEPAKLWLPSERPASAAALLRVFETGGPLEIHSDNARLLVEQLERPASKDSSLSLPDRKLTDFPVPEHEQDETQAPVPGPERMALIYAAVEHLTQNREWLSRQEIFEQLQKFGEVLGHRELESGLKALAEVGYLAGLEEPGELASRNLVKTETLRIHQETDRIHRQGLGACGALMYAKEAEPYLKHLEPNRAEVVSGILSNQDRVLPLVSNSPQATEEVLRDVTHALNRGSSLFRPKQLVGLTSSRRQADELALSTGLRTATWRSFLDSPEPQVWRGVMLAVDRAERLDGPTFHQLAQKAEEVGARLLLVGDPLGPEPFGPGRPFSELAAHSPLPTIGRESEPALASQIRGFVEGESPNGVRHAIDELHQKGAFHHVEDREALLAKTVQLKLDAPEKTLVSMADSKELNQRVHEAMKQAGRLSEEREVNRLAPYRPERPFEAKSYGTGDFAQLRQAFGPFAAGQVVPVTEGGSGREVTLNGQPVDIVKHGKELSFLRSEPVAMGVGEEVWFVRSDQGLQVGAGERGRLVKWGEEGRLVVQLNSGRQIEVDPKAYPHLDRAWCLAPHQMEGQGPLLLHAPATGRVDVARFHQALSHSKGDLTILTDNRPQLVERFETVLTSEPKPTVETIPRLNQERLRSLTGAPEPAAPVPSRANHVKLLEKTVRSLESHQAAFSKQTLFKQAQAFSETRIEREALEQSFNQLVEQGQLLNFGGDPQQANLTTPELYQIERDTLKRVEAGKGSCEPLVPSHRAEAWFAKVGLEGEQRGAVEMMVQSPDRFTFLRAESGADRREAFRKSAELIERRFFLKKIFDRRELRTLTLSNDAAGELNRSTGLPAETLAGFLAKDEGRLPEGAVYLVDEASLLDSRTMHRLVERVEQSGSRAVFVGDGHRLQAVGAGAPFREVMNKSGAEKAVLSAIEERSPAELAKWRGDLASQMEGQDPEALRRALTSMNLEGRLKAEPNQEVLIAKLAKDWADSKERPLVLSPAKSDREKLTEAIRSELADRGKLGEPVSLKARRALQLPFLERCDPRSYKVGDLVVVWKDFGEFKAREELRVEELRPESFQLVAGGKVLNLARDLDKATIFREEKVELATGDRVRFLASDRELGVKTGASGELLTLSENKAVLKLDDGHKLKFNPEKHPFLEPGYTDSLHRSAGADAEKVMLYLNSEKGPANRPEVLATALDIAKKDFKLYADHPALLTEQLEHRTQKTSTLGLDDSLKRDPLAEAFQQTTEREHQPLLDPGHQEPSADFGHDLGMDFGVG